MEKRKKVIVNPKIQMRLIALVFFIAIIPIIAIFVGLFIYLNNIIAGVPANNQALLDILASMKTLNIFVFGGFVVILVIFAFVLTQFLHRIVGPLYRIEKVLTHMLTTGDFSQKIRIRKDDYLHSLVDILNNVISRFNEKK